VRHTFITKCKSLAHKCGAAHDTLATGLLDSYSIREKLGSRRQKKAVGGYFTFKVALSNIYALQRGAEVMVYNKTLILNTLNF
jgi:hypothetical protein